MWAALRLGFAAVAPFLEACEEAGLPKGDYLVLRPSVNLVWFTNHPAGWADANRCLHALLVITGMPVDEVVRYSMHSLRHVYPTCGFQLMFPPSAVTLMGHWASKVDRMASVYDATRVSTELAYKANIAVNVQAGWRPVSDGDVPKPPLVPYGLSVPSSAPIATRPKKKAKKDSKPIDLSPVQCVHLRGAQEANSRYRLPEGVVQVMNEKSRLIHLYCPRSERVACAAWNAGTPENPTTNADFASSSGRWDPIVHDVRFCVNCHALRTISKLGGSFFCDNEAVQASDSSSSESSSCSASS